MSTFKAHGAGFVLDPSFTPGQNALLRFTVQAVDERQRRDKSGQMYNPQQFIKVKIWGADANAHSNLQHGQWINIEGVLTLNEKYRGRDGVERVDNSLKATAVALGQVPPSIAHLCKPPRGQGGNFGRQAPQQAPPQAQPLPAGFPQQQSPAPQAFAPAPQGAPGWPGQGGQW